MSFVYLASPYTHKDQAIRRDRYIQAKYYTAYALVNGIHLYSPIVHCHELAMEFNLPKDFLFWKAYNSAMLAKSSRVSILCIPGWEESKGVSYEKDLAQQLCIPIDYILSDTLEHVREFARAQKVN